MLRFLFGLFIILHGLVHLWYFTLSQGLVEFKPEVGSTGRSWLIAGLLGDSTTWLLGSILLVLSVIAFVISGIAVFARAAWWWPVLLGSAVFSSVSLLLFWDENIQLIVQKGLIGFPISLAVVLVLLLSKRSAFAF